MYGKEINYTVEKLSPDDVELLGDFCCGEAAIDRFLSSEASDAIDAVTYVCKNIDTQKIIGFATLSCSGIHYSYQNTRKTLPAIEIRYFAIAQEVQDLVFDETEPHFYFSDSFFLYMVKKCREITEEYIGARYILLYSVPNAKHFYERNFFKDYTEYMLADNISFLEGCIPMYMDL